MNLLMSLVCSIDHLVQSREGKIESFAKQLNFMSLIISNIICWIFDYRQKSLNTSLQFGVSSNFRDISTLIPISYDLPFQNILEKYRPPMLTISPPVYHRAKQKGFLTSSVSIETQGAYHKYTQKWNSRNMKLMERTG